MTHAPVLLPEALTGLRIQADGCYVDCTFGRGGHARAILSALGPAGRLIGFDRDPEAVVEGEALRQSDARFSILHRPFSEFQAGLASLGYSGCGRRTHGSGCVLTTAGYAIARI